ncbi:efflux RND transporter periplasmic adaptor subunit [Schlesneria paludicola]|uniref:efflux RND transporter periplasmic adaptor subunit n=1 Tax=Schlesneria paludicola TaxID=360056 RepID=UPI00029A4D1E|nr:efflux RND transporter periplasmic adaptor subunit [Schlesneria paludicola]
MKPNPGFLPLFHERPRGDVATLLLILCPLFVLGCDAQNAEPAIETHTIVVTKPEVRSITLNQRYVCQIHSRRHIEVKALERGYLDAISVKEGQEVKKGDELFKVIPIIYKAKYDAELAEQAIAQMEFDFSQKLSTEKVVSTNEVSLEKAKLLRAKAKTELAAAELNFATIKAPFDGIIDRLQHQEGSLLEESSTLTTLSDNSLMWVYFNVPEARYLEFMADKDQHGPEMKIDLVLANGKKFSQEGTIGAIEADFNNRTGNISFRADFPNPDRLLRHGQTGNVFLTHVQKDAMVIPQKSTFLILDKRFVYVVDKDDIARQRELEISHELDDIFIVKSGIEVDDKIVLEGVQQVHDGVKIQYETRSVAQVYENLKYHAE